MSHLMNTYARLPLAFTHGEGCRLYDTDGRSYLDALAGIAVNTLGHAHPRLVAALTAQAGRLLHVSNAYRILEQERLADRLAEISAMEEVFVCNSGCEANEAAIKLARMYAHRRGITQPAIIVMEHSFHGRTLATLSATGNYKAQAGFEPLVGGFLRVPFDDLAAIERVAEHHPETVAVLVEPVQGEGGVRVAHHDYLRRLRRVCDENGWLLMLDEVQCGIGRTGTWFAHQQAGIKPDVMALAKGLGSGVPVGACLTAGRAAGLFAPGNHGSTFGGNPLACTAALTTLAVVEEEELMPRAARIGARIRQALSDGLAGVAGVQEVRGDGLMIGIELDRPAGDIVQQALAEGLLINVTAERVVRLLPPLIYGEAEADELCAGLVPLIRRFLAA